MSIDRRTLISLGGLTLANAFFAACDSSGPRAAQHLLKTAARGNEGLERVLMRHTSMDRAGSSGLPGKALPSYYVSHRAPVWDEAVRGPWALEVSGAVRTPLRLTVADMMKMNVLT